MYHTIYPKLTTQNQCINPNNNNQTLNGGSKLVSKRDKNQFGNGIVYVTLESQIQSYPILIRVDSIRLYPARLGALDSSCPRVLELQDKLFCNQVTIVCTVQITETDHLTDFIVTAIEMINCSLIFDMCQNYRLFYKHFKPFIITNDNSPAAFVPIFIPYYMIKSRQIQKRFSDREHTASNRFDDRCVGFKTERK